MAGEALNLGIDIGEIVASAVKSETADKRLTEVKDDEKAALNENEEIYNGMINSAGKHYDDQIQASKDWAEEQKQLQQQQSDFIIQRIEQEKAQAEKDYTKEQSGAYVDWQKQSNQYGANAEQMAANGLTNTGYSESSQVSMYNAYQNRVATAREALVITKQNFDNSITEAQLQNSSLLAEIAFNAQQEQLELNMQKYLNGQTLLLEMEKSKREIEQIYHGRYQDVLSQIYQEIALSEQIREFNEKLKLDREQFEWQQDQANESAEILYANKTIGQKISSAIGKIGSVIGGIISDKASDNSTTSNKGGK